jgi:hypothetical protein
MLQDAKGQPSWTKRRREQMSKSAEEYKALVRRGWEEVINQRNLDFLAEDTRPMLCGTNLIKTSRASRK